MKITSALRQLKRILYYSKLFDTFVNTIIIFLLFSFLLFSFDKAWYFALIPAGLYFLPALFMNARRLRYRDVEEKVPELEWQLRAVADNMNKEDEVTKTLKKEVLGEIGKVRTSSFLNNKKTLLKLVTVAALSFMIVFVGLLNLHFSLQGITGFVPALDSILARIPQGERLPGDDTSPVEIKTEKDIYGKESIAQLGNKNLDIKIHPEEDSLDLGKINDPEKKDFRKKSATGDIAATADSSYQETIKKEHQEIIKQYFENLRGNEEK